VRLGARERLPDPRCQPREVGLPTISSTRFPLKPLQMKQSVRIPWAQANTDSECLDAHCMLRKSITVMFDGSRAGGSDSSSS
jgi:hypothetical protein